MILKYVLKNFRRRKVRTILMVLSLIVSTGLIVAMSATVETIRLSNVDFIAAEAGRHDLTILRTDTSQDLFIAVDETSQRVLAADETITAVFPRFLSEVELNVGNIHDAGMLLALDPTENIGQIEVLSGTYQLGEMQAAILRSTALEMGNLEVGEQIDVTYSFPQPREAGSVGTIGGSQRRAVARFTISAIVRPYGLAPAFGSGLIVHIDDAQAAFGLSDRAEMLIALVEQDLYETGNAEVAALRVRDVAINVQEGLGDQFVIRAHKANSLDEIAGVFLAIQALISTYGLMSLGVVGLLVYTLVMTNVHEQRREMAILRILGSRRIVLFGIVVAEVLVIGVLGIGLGVLLGEVITTFGVVPLIEYLLRQEGQAITLRPAVSLVGILPAIISAFVVLVISAIKPARDAARTKVVHAINPSVADNIQLEDLDELRERRPTLKLFFIGLAMVFVVFLAAGLIFAVGFENPAALATLALTIGIFTVVGIVFVFFILTRPLEKLILLVIGLISSRLTYFARRNLGRSTERNTLISLLVLFSGVLPSFLATQSAIDNKNIEINNNLDMGAPVAMEFWSRYGGGEYAHLSYLSPSFVEDEVQAVPGIAKAVGLTYEYGTQMSDAVEMRTGWMNLVGVSGNLSDVLFEDLMIFSAGGPTSLTQILSDPTAVVISQGMAEGLAVPLGGTIQVQGEGLDHKEELIVVGIAQRLPGFSGMGRIRSQAMNGGTVLISMDGFRRLTTHPNEAVPASDDPLLRRVLATLSDDADPLTVEIALHDSFDQKYDHWTRIAKLQLERARRDRVSEQALLLVLTLLSFITAVFGVFAVIFVTIYARRIEIGMMKAFGTRNWELNGILSVESIAMTLSAALAGIVAGSTMSYLVSYAFSLAQQRPQQFAIDTTVMPFVVIMVTLASILGTVFSARRIVKRKAVEILRMS
jgi:ABC-type lipoprotein release transport system permease subunit